MTINKFDAAALMKRGARPTDPALQQEIEQFYYREAALLDARAYEAWLGLMEPDIRYVMPLRTTRAMREADREFGDDGEFAHFDETYATLYGRVRKALSEFGWAENPPSRTRHLVSNVMIEAGSERNSYEVSSVFLLYRNRLERQTDLFAGERRDLLRRSATDMGFRIARRTIVIDQSTLLSNNLSIFF